MATSSFPVISTTDFTSNQTTATYEPGTVYAVNPAGRNWSLVEYIQLDNNGCSQGEVLVHNYATLVSYSVAKAATTDMGAPAFRGIAAATIASQRFGFMTIGGYVEKGDVSLTVASGDFLTISGSTAGKLSPNNGAGGVKAFWNATLGQSSTLGTAPFVVAVARGAYATGVGSMILNGVWG